MDLGKWFAGDSEEYYSVGPCETEEQALRDFRVEYPEDERVVTGISVPHHFEVDANAVVESMDEVAANTIAEYDYRFEHLPEKAVEQLQQRLTRAFVDWAAEWNLPSFVPMIEARTVHRVQPDGSLKSEPFDHD